MSPIQRLCKHLVPRAWFASMEAESRAWIVRCPACGAVRSIWDLGGIRWKAAGTKRIWTRCASCGRRGWQAVYRRDAKARTGRRIDHPGSGLDWSRWLGP